MSIRAELRRSFVAGLLLLAPLAVTFLVVRLSLSYLADVLDPFVATTGLAAYTSNDQLLAQVVAAVVLAAAVIALGYVAQRSLGQRLFGGFDRIVGIVPLVSTVYTGVRQVASAMSSRESRFESVVLVEYPRLGVYSLGFVTGESPDVVAAVAGEPAYNVFVPNSPNPTGGRLVLVPESRIHHTDLPVGRGIRLIVTTGIAGSEEEYERLRAEGDDGRATGRTSRS